MDKFQSPLPAFGFVSSPLLDDDAVYVQAGAAFVKLDKRTGAVRWRALVDDGGMMGSAFSSPVFATIGGKRQLVVQTRLAMAGVDPDSGRELWKTLIPADRGMNIFTPVVLGDAFFASAYGGGSRRFDIERRGDDFLPRQVWELKTQGYMSTPVVIDGHAYMHLRNQRLTCIDLATGREKWTTSQLFGKYWSLVTNGRLILALDEKGILYLIRVNPEKFELIDSRKVSQGEAWAHLAVCGDELFIRDLNSLAKWQWRGSPAAAPSP
jgi:outer membrane protein assembly factor BamB